MVSYFWALLRRVTIAGTDYVLADDQLILCLISINMSCAVAKILQLIVRPVNVDIQLQNDTLNWRASTVLVGTKSVLQSDFHPYTDN